MIIGTELDQEKIEKELDQCLVNGDEIDSDWNQLEDPIIGKFEKLRSSRHSKAIIF